jgi:hypothetical protein
MACQSGDLFGRCAFAAPPPAADRASCRALSMTCGQRLFAGRQGARHGPTASAAFDAIAYPHTQSLCIAHPDSERNKPALPRATIVPEPGRPSQCLRHLDLSDLRRRSDSPSSADLPLATQKLSRQRPICWPRFTRTLLGVDPGQEPVPRDACATCSRFRNRRQRIPRESKAVYRCNNRTRAARRFAAMRIPHAHKCTIAHTPLQSVMLPPATESRMAGCLLTSRRRGLLAAAETKPLPAWTALWPLSTIYQPTNKML